METLRSGDAAVTIDHGAGGRLASLVVGGHELLVTERRPDVPGEMSWGCFPMAPWAGRIRDGRFVHSGETHHVPLDLPPHAIHGTVFRRRWERLGAGHLRSDLGPDWPWAGTATQTVAISPSALTLSIELSSDDGPMPVSAGWHPWFRRSIGSAEAEIEIDAGSMWRRDADGIPDGTLLPPGSGPWDDCFTAISWPVAIRWPGVIDLSIRSSCGHVVVYDEPEHALCVEPQSAPPDAHNSGADLVVVEPGRPLRLTSSWTWRT